MTLPGDEEWTVGKLLNWTAAYFADKGLDEPLLSAQLLLAKVFDCSKVDLYLRHGETVNEAARSTYRELVRRAVAGEPIAYLVGGKEFFSLAFAVRSGVLIPRAETEFVVQWVIRNVRSDSTLQRESLILELGTGSGCIAVSLAKYLPGTPTIIATDVSIDALAQARENCFRHGVTDRVRLVAGDLLAPIAAEKRFDFIVANLPYVTEEDYQALPRDIKDYEPPDALLGGKDGLWFIRRVIAEAGRYLRNAGRLVLEIGYNQSDPVRAMLQEHAYDAIEFEEDHARIPRVVIARVEASN